jgi:hypothetical protein
MPTASRTQPQPKRLASLEKAADHYSISVRTLRRYGAAGKVTLYRMGPRMLRVDLNELDQLLLRPIPTVGGARAS